MHFDSRLHIEHKDGFEPSPTDYRKIATEQMVRSMSWEHFRQMEMQQTAPLTNRAMWNISDHFWKNKDFWSIDSRVHMLMEGMIPCIPGWHHDDVQRSGTDNQPDYNHPLRCEHAVFIIGSDVSATEFAVGNANFKSWNGQGSMYGQWTDEVDAHVKNKVLDVVKAPEGQWVYFDDRTWHRGVECKVKFGHRLFIRIGMHYMMVDGKRVYVQPPSRANEIRRNAQVYMKTPAQGW